MTPKEKAEELAKKFFDNVSPLTKKYAKQCALIAVQEIVGTLENINTLETQEGVIWNVPSVMSYWENVQEELNKL